MEIIVRITATVRLGDAREAKPPKKSYRVDVSKLRRAQKCLGTRTEVETIDKALDLAADEAELAKALKRLVEKGRGHFVDAASD